jgi:hypothetical protein
MLPTIKGRTFPAVLPIREICRANGEGLSVLLVGIMVFSHGCLDSDIQAGKLQMGIEQQE